MYVQVNCRDQGLPRQLSQTSLDPNGRVWGTGDGRLITRALIDRWLGLGARDNSDGHDRPMGVVVISR